MLLGVAAPWSERKGLQDYIALSKILPPGYIIVLIGLDKEQIESLPGNMVGIGRTQNQAELAAYYSLADILLSLSTGETFGMTMAEAYGCGTPVIVYDNTAQPEIVTPETGRAVKTGDIEVLAATIREFRDTDFKKHYSADCQGKSSASAGVCLAYPFDKLRAGATRGQLPEDSQPMEQREKSQVRLNYSES